MIGAELPEMRVPPPGPRSRALASRLALVESPVFEARRDARAQVSGEDHDAVVYSFGHGSNIVDVDGNRYVDLTAGFGALLLGYGPNAATEAARTTLDELTLALGDVYPSELKVRACEALSALFPERGARVMLGLSGADAVTCALKTAALATKKPAVVSFQGSYHGLSHGPLAASGFSAAFREPFAAQLGLDVTFAPYPSSAAQLDASLSAVRDATRRRDVGCVLVEPILGRGGCIVPPAAFLPALRAICDESGALLIADEIWTGMGRAGTILACERAGVVPDVVCLGKGLAGGIAISACVGRARVMEAWGAHGGATIHTGTHFGSPPACAALIATASAIVDGELAARAEDLGESALQELASACGDRAEVRGRGLMIGIGLGAAPRALSVARALLARGYVVLTGGVRGDALTLSPALTIAPDLLSAFAESLGDLLRAQ